MYFIIIIKPGTCNSYREYVHNTINYYTPSQSIGEGPGVVWEVWFLRLGQHRKRQGRSCPHLVAVVKPLGSLFEAEWRGEIRCCLVRAWKTSEVTFGVDMELVQLRPLLFRCWSEQQCIWGRGLSLVPAVIVGSVGGWEGRTARLVPVAG